MRPSIKALAGILSHIPGIYMLFFMGFMIFMITHPQAPVANSSGIPTYFVLLFVCHILVMLLMFLLMVFWIMWLIKGSNLPQEAKIIWSLACFFIGPLAMPILYWLYLRKTPEGPYFFGSSLS